MGIFNLFRRRIERRKHPRQRVITTAWLRVADDPLPSVCVIWDLSEGGARLASPRPEAVPDEFMLALNRDDKNGATCRVVWRSNEQIGLKFLAGSNRILDVIEHKRALAP